MCLKFYYLDPVKFLASAGLAWQAALKNTEVRLELDLGEELKKTLGEEYVMQFIDMLKLVINIRKTMIKILESSYVKYWDVNDLNCWAMSPKLPVNKFEWIEDTFQFKEGFIKKTIMKKAMKVIFLKLMFSILKNGIELHNDLSFSPEKIKIGKVEKLVSNLYDKTEYAIHIKNL